MRKIVYSLVAFYASAVNIQSNIQSQLVDATEAFTDIELVIDQLVLENDPSTSMSESWQKEYSTVIQKHARQIVVDIYNELKENDPLLQFCKEARNCVTKLRETLTTQIVEKWQTVFAGILATVEANVLTTKKMVKDVWADAHQCQDEFPCCTFGDEYQYNVKMMITDLKKSSHEAYLQWSELEVKRVDVYDECQEDVPASCSELNKCWDSSDRADNWPTCSCPDWDWARKPCGSHECPSGRNLNQETCTCDCPVTCAAGEILIPETCECNAAPITEVDTNAREFFGQNNVEFEWVGSTQLYEGSEKYPLVRFPSVLSEDVRLTKICSGGYYGSTDNSRYCGFQFHMSDGSKFPNKEFDTVFENNESCVDLQHVQQYKRFETEHYQSVGSQYLQEGFSGKYLATIKLEFDDGNELKEWKSLACYYDSNSYPDRVTTEHFELAAGQQIHGFRFNTYSSEQEFFMYQFYFAKQKE